MPHVVIIGAGVIALQTALTLLSSPSSPKYSVTLLATHLPGDSSPHFTSPWAGAHWRTHASSSDTRQQKWDMETYDTWRALIDEAKTVQDRRELGLKVVGSWSFWDRDPEGRSLWWASEVRGFETVATGGSVVRGVEAAAGREGQGDGKGRVQAAARFDAVAVNVPVYLTWLRERVVEKGGVFIRATVPVDRGLVGALEVARATVRRITGREGDVFINATGLGAGKLCGDGKCRPVKGQTVLVRGEADAIRTRLGQGYIAYVIPRPGSGTTVLGGTKDVGTWDERVSEEVTRQILEGARGLAPELLTGRDGGFEVVSAQVGFRPGREGGARVEVEKVGGFKVVHAYGVDGAGYQNSVGLAKEVEVLVQSVLGEEKAKL